MPIPCQASCTCSPPLARTGRQGGDGSCAKWLPKFLSADGPNAHWLKYFLCDSELCICICQISELDWSKLEWKEG